MLNKNMTNKDGLELIVQRAIWVAVALMLVASVVQTVVFLDGHATHLVSPVFLVGAIALAAIGRMRRLQLSAKARLVAVVLGVISVAISSASATALTVATMILIMATSIWLFTQPSFAAVAFWFLSSSAAVITHMLFTSAPESHPAKAIMTVLIGGAVSLLIYTYARVLHRQSELLANALGASRQGIVKRTRHASDLLWLDEQAQLILGCSEPTLRYFELLERVATASDRDKLLMCCSQAVEESDRTFSCTLQYGDRKYVRFDIFNSDHQQIWLIEDVTAETLARLKNESLLQEQQDLLAKIKREQQVNDLAISAANLVIYELDHATGFARVVAGQSNLPELWCTKPFINVLGDVMPKEDRRKLQAAIENPGELAEVLIRHPQTGEPIYWGQFGFTSVRESGGRRIQMGYRLITDSLVSARLEAQQAREESEHMLSRLNDVASGGRVGLFRHNLIDDSWECNDIYREFYGLPEDEFPEVTTELIDSRFPSEARSQQIKERVDARVGYSPINLRRSLLLPDGTRRELKGFAKPEYENNKIVAMVGSFFDVTAEKVAETELTRANARLSELLERQRSMFAVIGHELRTPVASIEMLANDTDLSDAEKIDLVSGISKGLLGVLEDLRTVIAPERVKESQIVVDYPSVVIKRALVPLSGLLQERSVQLHLDLPSDQMQCRFNAQALRQLVTNLVKNAAIHADGQNIYVALTETSANEQSICAQLRVEDDGKGIPSDQVSALFGAYARGDTESDGSGLGLFICSELAMTLGGQIHYEASTRGGAAFVVNIDVVSGEHTHPTNESEAAQYEFAGKHILLAEDDRTLQLLTERILTKAGASVKVCGDGQEALEAYQAEPFDLVVTDIMMPKLNGYGLAKALRAAGYEGPIIGATAAVVGSETDELIAAGADAAISKPVSLEKLEAELARLETSVESL